MRDLLTPPVQLEAAARGSDLFIYGPIGAGFEGGVTAADFQKALAARAAGPLTVYVNSPGGDFFQGAAIAALLRRTAEAGTKVTAVIDGEASSAAAIIVAAADRVEAMPGASALLHKVRAPAFGPASELRALADSLDKAQPAMTQMLVRKTGKTAEAIDQVLDQDRYHSTEELVALGLVDGVRGQQQSRKVALVPTTLAAFAEHTKSRNEAIEWMTSTIEMDGLRK